MHWCAQGPLRENLRGQVPFGISNSLNFSCFISKLLSTLVLYFLISIKEETNKDRPDFFKPPTGLRVRTAALKSCMKNEDSVRVIK